jgi:hypothetical protein
MSTIRWNSEPNARPGNPGGDTLDGQEAVRVERDHLSWAETHEREVRRHNADLAQITTHHDLDGTLDAIGQQQAWARRHAHEQHLHDSAMVQLHHQAGGDATEDPAH